MRSPPAVGRLVAAQPRLQFLDSRQQLARQYGAGVVQSKVAAQSHYARQLSCRVARVERPAAARASGLDAAEADQAAHEVGMESRLACEHLELDGRAAVAPAPDDRQVALRRGRRHLRFLRGSNFETLASRWNSSRSSPVSFFGTSISTV